MARAKKQEQQEQELSGKTKKDQQQEPMPSRDATVRGAAIEYRIERVADFLLVPEDRIADCLKEFATCLEIARPTVALLREVEREMEGREPVIEWPLRAFTWIDDGANDVTIRIAADDSVSSSRPEGRASSEETT